MQKRDYFLSLAFCGYVKRESKWEQDSEGGSYETESRRTKELGGATESLDMSSLLSRKIAVRIIHPGRREELYQNAIPASQLMEKYPGMSIARPEVFTNPHESLLYPEDELLPGQKYYIVPSTTVQKLKRKHPQKSRVEEENWNGNPIVDVGRESMEESICYANEFYASRSRWTKFTPKKGIRAKKPFKPPFPRAKSSRGLGWEPSLSSVQELSP